MELVVTIVLGFCAGLVAQVMSPGVRPLGLVATAALGVVGAIIATIVGHALGLYSGRETAGFVGALIGALVLITLFRLVMRNRGSARASRPRFEPHGRESVEP